MLLGWFLRTEGCILFNFSLFIGSLLATTISKNDRTPVPTGTSTDPDEDVVKDPYLINNSSIICNKSDENVEPEFNYISPTVIKCISQKHIYWNISFQSGSESIELKNIPYKIESERKPCVERNQIEQKASKENYFSYYESTLEFKTDLADRNEKEIKFRCFINVLNETLASTWVSYVKPNGTVNLTEGRQESTNTNVRRNRNLPSANYPSEFEDCIDVAPLISNVSRNKHAFFDNSNNTSNSRPVQYLNCTSWSNCQQLVRHVFPGKDICQVKCDPPYCDTNPGFCEYLRNSISTNSGIIYYPEGNGTVRISPFLKTVDKQDGSHSLHLITDVTRNQIRSVRLTACRNLTTVSCQHAFAFRCKAPRFLAVKGFEWTVKYYKPSNFSAACQLEREDTDEYYIEKCSYEIPPGLSNSTIYVECKVYFQSGRPVIKDAEETYPPIPLNTNPAKERSKESLITGAAVGISVSLVVLVPILIYCSCKIRRQKKKLYFSTEDADNFVKGLKMLNELAPSEAQSATVLPYDVSLEIPRESIKIEPTILGKGAFGKVMKGRIERRYVAIKTTNKTGDQQYFRALLSELKIMSFVGKHPNIVELLGANTERIRKQDVYLIFEFCQNGNALEFIRKRREQFVDQLSYREGSEMHILDNIDNTVQYENSTTKKLCSEDLVRWAVEIATGMDFIATKNVYHGDLAARNILLSHNLIAKVGDFGLARELKNYSLYVQRAECPLPLKWMSVEALRDLEFSIKSDVWSYGITLWEIFSLGCTPYPGVEWNFQAWKMLEDGERMDRPPHATQSIHDILLKCWLNEPKDRPSFMELKQVFADELEKIARC